MKMSDIRGYLLLPLSALCTLKDEYLLVWSRGIEDPFRLLRDPGKAAPVLRPSLLLSGCHTKGLPTPGVNEAWAEEGARTEDMACAGS